MSAGGRFHPTFQPSCRQTRRESGLDAKLFNKTRLGCQVLRSLSGYKVFLSAFCIFWLVRQRSVMFSFDGQAKKRPVVSLGGTSRKVGLFTVCAFRCTSVYPRFQLRRIWNDRAYNFVSHFVAIGSYDCPSFNSWSFCNPYWVIGTHNGRAIPVYTCNFYQPTDTADYWY